VSGAVGEGQRPGAAWALATTAAVVRRPTLWFPALRQVRRLAPRGWWRRPPFLPLPDPGYLQFRLQTMYGDARDPSPDDVVTYLDWCRRFGAVSGGSPRSRTPRQRVGGDE
jgi:hypothetical protein